MWHIFFLPQLRWNNLLSVVTDVRRTNHKLLRDEATSVSVSITPNFDLKAVLQRNACRYIPNFGF